MPQTKGNAPTDKSPGADRGAQAAALPRGLQDLMEQPLDVKLQLIQHHATMARLLASELLEEEVERLAGERYSRDKPHGGRYCRWGSNPGSIRIAGERVPLDVPRVRDREASAERPLQSYQAMKRAHVPEELTDAILLGLAQGDYERVAGQFIDGFGLSQSSVSRRFTERAQEALETFEQRSLAEETYVALWIDGKHVAGQQMIICMGVTVKGYKRVLGFTEATTEHSAPIKELFRDLLERGLRFAGGVLCIIDGSKGLRKAIADVFGRKALVQRCQWHKRENVVGYLPKADQPTWRAKLQRAYEEGSYATARERLMGLRADLEQLNRRAARSLTEGLEETLTLHRLGLFDALGRSLKTTNCIESLNDQVGRRIAHVKRWHHSPQRHRWMALALLEAEGRMHRLAGFRHLPALQEALKKHVRKPTGTQRE
ncbi:MAG: IS256 family transposase [Bacteroidetes bacterium]|nr:IS256 family transposase [Bacteroidota bacterium]